MPSTGSIIGGIITVLIGAFMFLCFRDFGVYIERINIRWPWEWWETPLYFQIMSFLGGLCLIGSGLNTLNFNVCSIIMIVAVLPVIRYFKTIGHVLIAFFSRHEPSELTIKKGQGIFLLLTIAWAIWAIYLSVIEWFAETGSV